MESILLSKLNGCSDPLNIKVEQNDTSTTYSTHVCRDAAKDMKVDLFVDLTSEEKCFVCDNEIKDGKYIPLAYTKTNTTRTLITSKIGDLMGKGYIIVVSENDYICRNCLRIFNRLDQVEMEALKLQAKAVSLIKQTYLSEGKVINILKDSDYKQLEQNIWSETE